MKLRKKPVIIEANQYTNPDNPPFGAIHCGEYWYPKTDNVYNEKQIKLGDWLCTGDGKSYFVLTDDYIKEHFEEVE